MGLMDDAHDDDAQDQTSDSDSGTYIQFISGPGHRDWKESWSSDAADTIAEAYELAAPEASDGIVNTFANAGWEDRHHFYAELTVALGDIFSEGDYQQMLRFLMGDPSDEDTADAYADQLAEFLADEEDIAEALLERVNEPAAPADD